MCGMIGYISPVVGVSAAGLFTTRCSASANDAAGHWATPTPARATAGQTGAMIYWARLPDGDRVNAGIENTEIDI